MRIYRARKMPLGAAIVNLPLFVFFVSIANSGDLKYSLSLGALTAVIIIVWPIIQKYKYKSSILKSGINVIDRMSGEDFEKLLMAYFKKLGYKVKATPKSGDFGADVILEKGTTKTVVQAKRWKNKVGVGAVQEITAAISFYNADKGIVITNSYFTPNAKALARSNNIDLWDRNVLIKSLQLVNGKDIAANIAGAE